MTTQLTVTLDGVPHTLSADPARTLLDTMEASGLQPPSSCRDGSCGTCMCTLLEGDVELHHNNVLSQADMDAGWIIACQALPRSAEVRIKFPD